MLKFCFGLGTGGSGWILTLHVVVVGLLILLLLHHLIEILGLPNAPEQVNILLVRMLVSRSVKGFSLSCGLFLLMG